ncbi:MAG: YceI family protein [Bacteroidota bacterium]|nr:YceI family protein [Bacteroidota bacterium]
MKKNKLYTLTILCVFLNIVLKSQNTEWTVTTSKITFKIKNAGFNVDGTFGGLKAKINFDASKSYSNTIEASVDAKTLNSGNSGRDGHLKKEEYFGVDKFPIISLTGTTFAKQPDGSFKGYFKLTLKNTTKDIVIPFTFVEKEGKGTFKGGFTINRLDYGVGSSSMILSNNANLTLEVNVIKK